MVLSELHRLNLEVGTHRDRIAWLDANARGTNAALTDLHDQLASLNEWCIIIDARLTLIIDALDHEASEAA